MVYNNDDNYAAIDYLATLGYYKLMRSSAVIIIALISSHQRIEPDHTTPAEDDTRVMEKCLFISHVAGGEQLRDSG